MRNGRGQRAVGYWLLAVCYWLMPSLAQAQDSLATKLTYDLTTEANMGSGDYTAYQLVSNRHHVVGTRSNTAYLRGALKLEHTFKNGLSLSSVVDAIGSVHADHKVYLQQCYVDLSSKSFTLEIGSREEAPILRHAELSSGAFAKGINAKPIPQIQIRTNGFRPIPKTKGWLEYNFGFGYGMFLDGGYREKQFEEAQEANNKYATGILYHQKHLYFRSNPEKLFFAMVGIEHAVQFCGSSYTKQGGGLIEKRKPVVLKSFWNVILPLGDSNYFSNEAMEDWVYGNHLGSMTIQLGWNINKEHLLQAYVDDIFEDGSGIRKGNGWDGLWGIQYTNKAKGHQLVRGAVIEYFQSTNQSGPLHWDGGDYPEPYRHQIKDYITGNDNYYNHGFYVSYTQYGMSMGTPLISSPRYNKDGYNEFRDNRIKAWHLGVEGEINERLSYLIKGSYRDGWGTYWLPLPTKHHSFDALLMGRYQVGAWNFSAAYAFDEGNIYGDNSTFNIKIGYHGKIL